MLRTREAALLVLSVSSIIISSVYTLSYSDLQSFNASCPPRDSCANRSLEDHTHFSHNCECDEDCDIYGDCCVDAPQMLEPSRPRTTGLRCVEYGIPYQGVYVVDKCSRDWTGSEQIRRKCERFNDVSDPVMAAPATDTERGITYRNRYCSECNGVSLSRLLSWEIGVTCFSLTQANTTGSIASDYVRNNLFFKRDYPYRNTWGVYHWNNTLNMFIYHPCMVSFILPDYLASSVRFCRPSLVSTCSPTWRTHQLRRHCEAYMAMVYVDSVPFRNPHCALCNNADLRTLTCPTGMLSRRRPPMSFAVLLDVNTSDGNTVGMIEDNTCQTGEKYDPFFKKCRALVCALPGYKMVKNKCVKP